QMGWSGFLLSFVSILPQNIIIIPAFIFIGAVSASFSITLIRKIFMRGQTSMQLPMIPFFSRYVVFLVAAIAVITVAAGVEAYLSPSLMETVISKIK
ncbi:stage II sporulation protein M, partial [Rossellomorea marisflavi]